MIRVRQDQVNEMLGKLDKIDFEFRNTVDLFYLKIHHLKVEMEALLEPNQTKPEFCYNCQKAVKPGTIHRRKYECEVTSLKQQ